ncbi:MAG: DNA mismatch repair protein MutS [Salinivirgaceae bacterium]|nr:DNA mismatch repair protein MutS [Salinivirgaceae bacterium]
MKQYYSIKTKHPDAILLFRVGDFYETFSDDAIKASGILGITLTKRANGAASFVELAGFPYHALDTYLPKLVRAGQRVAICEQLEDPKMTKNIVKRGVTELVTPGVSVNDNILNHKENNFLASVYVEKSMAGAAFLDISTGEFYTSEGSFDYINKLLQSFKPKEILYERSKKEIYLEQFGHGFYNYPLDEWIFNSDTANDRLLKHFETQSLKGFGISTLQYGIIAAGAILYYLDLTQHHQIGNITRISRIAEEEYVWLDRFTIRNLEIFGSMNEDGKSLIDVMDHTLSPMGSRMLKRWLSLPLKNINAINDRLNTIEYFQQNSELKSDFELHVKQIGDLERLISKVALGRINPREVLALKNALEAINPIKNLCEKAEIKSLNTIGEQLNPCKLIKEKIENEIHPDPPTAVNKGSVIANGVNAELDELRSIAFSGKDYLLGMQTRESERTGIPSLKIAFNNVFGYYIEVRNTHKDKVPEEWIRKQTLVSAERYITEELKEYESKILGAEEKILALETKLFNELVFSLSEYISAIQLDAHLLSKLDCLLSFTTLAERNNYCKPTVNESNIIEIIQGRHPVIEKQMPAGEEYIANDVLLNQHDQQIIIITGPNMAGKSALLRQTALIVLMSQVGSFVPAQAVNLGYVDKIFTRVGASDNISMGESTFMVEMNEAASILNNMSDRSLILLDELGRGTSTYDGISIAWAIVEYIHEHPNASAKTLFATHYHELNEMTKSFKRVKNFNVAVKEINKKVIFLRKLQPGGSEHSFGIHVAKMAGMPKSVVQRAEKILLELEQTRGKQDLDEEVKELAKKREGMQLSFFQLDDPVLKQVRDEIKNLDINNLTPVEALNKLNEIKKLTGL